MQTQQKDLMKFPEQFRITTKQTEEFGSLPGERFGMFFIPRQGRAGQKGTRSMKVIACNGIDPEGNESVDWEHVSVSLVNDRHDCPTWDEMCFIKDLFWEDDACVVQLHPAKAYYVNQHPGCLHLWRWTGGQFPTPPIHLV